MYGFSNFTEQDNVSKFLDYGDQEVTITEIKYTNENGKEYMEIVFAKKSNPEATNKKRYYKPEGDLGSWSKEDQEKSQAAQFGHLFSAAIGITALQSINENTFKGMVEAFSRMATGKSLAVKFVPNRKNPNYLDLPTYGSGWARPLGSPTKLTLTHKEAELAATGRIIRKAIKDGVPVEQAVSTSTFGDITPIGGDPADSLPF